MSKLSLRGYMIGGVVLTSTPFFSVPKVMDDIQMVFEETVRGINDSFWDTNFMIPVMDILLIMVGPAMHIVYLEVWDMFYNFRLSMVMAKYCGVELGNYMGRKR